MRKTNKIGSVSVFRFKDDEKYTMKDLLYVNSQHNSIEKMYKYLYVLYSWSLNLEHKKSITQLTKDYKMDLKVIGLLKKYKYIDDNFKWLPKTQPSKADAVFLRLKLKNKNKRNR